ncbi:MAG: hypothetical protein FJ145_10930 [Deltaproteobacteria bacterium]|nr:hypothetical protein [Deltaproteobacteria bacterium]
MACKPWLDAELAALKSKIVVCMGSTATSWSGSICDLPRR